MAYMHAYDYKNLRFLILTSVLSAGEEQNNYDAFMLMEAPKDIVDVVKRNYMSWRVAQRYARYFVPDKEPIPTEAVRLEYVAERKQDRREYCTCMRCGSRKTCFACGFFSSLCYCCCIVYVVLFVIHPAPGAQHRTSSTAVPITRQLSRPSSGKMLHLRFDDGNVVKEEKKEEKKEEEEVEEVELHETLEGDDIEELRGFMFNMLKALLFDLVVGM